MAAETNGERAPDESATLLAREWLTSRDGLLLLGGVAWVLAYLVWAAVSPRPLAPIVPGVAASTLCAAAAVSAWLASRHDSLGARTRLAWRLCSAAFLLYGLGYVLWLVVPLPYPAEFITWPDLTFLTYYPFLFAGLLAFPTPRRSKGELLKLWLDVGTVMLAGGAVIWFLILAPALNAKSPSTLSNMVTIAFPIGDLALLFASAYMLLHRQLSRGRRTLALLAVGCLAIFAGDLLYGWVIFRKGVFTIGTWRDAPWLAGMLLWLGAAQLQRWYAAPRGDGETTDAATAPYHGVSLLPYIAVAIGVGLLLVVAMPHWTTSLGVMVITTIILTALVVARQITAVRENARLHAERAAQEARFRSLVQHSSDVICVVDQERRVQFVSQSVERVFGWPTDAVAGKAFVDMVHPDDVEEVRAFFDRTIRLPAGTSTTVCRVQHWNGTWRHIEAIGTSRLHDPSVGGIVLNTRDVSERIQLEAELTHRAYHDPLTGLANRSRFRSQVHQALLRADRAQSEVAVLFLDLDDFKNVNDSLGHLEGDRLLLEVASRLLSATRGTDTVARLGGDEFAVLVEHLHNDSDPVVIAERITGVMRRPVSLPGGDVVVGASLGIARWQRGLDVDDLLRNADLAMYAAKRRGRGRYVFFETEMHAEIRERVSLEADLRSGIARGELRLVYQPIVELATGEIRGVETLVRWQHPERGLLTPDRFIPLAEETGLIVPLGRWVTRNALEQAARWQRETIGQNPFSVGVNVSGRQIQLPQFAEELGGWLRELAYPPEQFVLEITESEIMRRTETLLERLHALRALGVRLAVDDFGTGYSSLGYLHRFPLNVLKIDKIFIGEVATAGSGHSLARMIVALGGALSLSTVAEGVETEDQAAILSLMGCQHAQGYFFSPPVSAARISEMLANGRRLPERGALLAAAEVEAEGSLPL